jgi:hypothetical protein
MRVSDPGECCDNCDDDDHEIDHTSGQNRRMIPVMVYEDVGNVSYEPDQAGNGASGVNSTKVLQHRSTSETEPQRSFLERVE